LIVTTLPSFAAGSGSVIEPLPEPLYTTVFDPSPTVDDDDVTSVVGKVTFSRTLSPCLITKFSAMFF